VCIDLRVRENHTEFVQWLVESWDPNFTITPEVYNALEFECSFYENIMIKLLAHFVEDPENVWSQRCDLFKWRYTESEDTDEVFEEMKEAEFEQVFNDGQSTSAGESGEGETIEVTGHTETTVTMCFNVQCMEGLTIEDIMVAKAEMVESWKFTPPSVTGSFDEIVETVCLMEIQESVQVTVTSYEPCTPLEHLM